MDLIGLALLLTAGLAAGTVNSIAGGGTLVVFPALIAFGLSPVSANVTNSVSVFTGFLGGAYGSRGDLEPEHRRRLLTLAPTAAAGTAVGCLLLLATPPRAFDLVVPFLVLGAAAALAFSERLRGVVGHPASLSPRRRTLTLHLTVGFGAVYGGYFGAALSIILVAVLALVLDEGLARINAHKNVLSGVIGFVTLLAFGLFGPVNWVVVAVLVPTTVAGGYLGARLARRLPARTLRAVIVGYATVVGLVLLWRGLS